jgi:hypothetical protein
MEQLFNEIDYLNKQDILNDILSKQNKSELVIETTKTNDQEKSHKDFGENIKFYSFYETKSNSNNIVVSDDSDEYDTDDDYSLDEEDSDYEQNDKDAPEVNSFLKLNFPTESSNAYDKERQQQQLEVDENLKYIKWTNDLSKELCSIVYELLSKSTNINQMQNELVELLGFENIELSEFLLSNKDKVVQAYKYYLIDGCNNSNIIGLSQRAKKHINTGNTNELALKQSKLSGAVTSDIMVHTETEKKIKKLIRKEEKRLNKHNQPKLENEFGDEFDPVLLRN